MDKKINFGSGFDFSAKNPVTGKSRVFGIREIGWLSQNGIFHFNAKAPAYAKKEFIKRYGKLKIIKGWIGYKK
jgi:hypothetical protein